MVLLPPCFFSNFVWRGALLDAAALADRPNFATVPVWRKKKKKKEQEEQEEEEEEEEEEAMNCLPV